MNQTSNVVMQETTRAAKRAYAALFLGIIAAVSFSLPILATLLGIAAIAIGFNARRSLLRDEFTTGIWPSLFGVVFGLIGVSSSLPWLFAVIFVFLADGLGR